MAKMISELGADVFDDTVVTKKTRFTRKQKNYMIGLPIVGVLAIALGVVYALASNVWLKDYENMPYITYLVNSKPNEDGEITASIGRVSPSSKYPTTFRVPSRINGYKITKIDDGAFAGCDRLKKVVMTDNIISIGEQAFAGCSELGSFTFSKNVNYIGKEAFMDTKFINNLPVDEVVSVNSVLIHVGQELLGNKTALVTKDNDYQTRFANYKANGYTLFDMDALETITDLNNLPTSEVTITQWMEGIFDNSPSIEVVEIPKALAHVPAKAFQNCSKIKEVLIHDQVQSIGESAFDGCSNLVDIDIPSNVKTIESYAFRHTGAEINSIPSTVETLGEGVFQYCSGLTSFTIPATIEKIPNYMFEGCENLSTFAFEDSSNIKSIGRAAFAFTSLSTFRVPENVLTINESLFQGCTNLTKVELLENVNNETLDDEELEEGMEPTLKGVSEIYGYAFDGCTSLNSIVLYDNNGNILSRCSDSNSYYFPKTLKTAAISLSTTSAYDAFANTPVKAVYFPNSLLSIGIGMFKNAANLESVSFENVATSKLSFVEEGAFENCVSLKEFIFPDYTYIVNTGVFKGCTSLVKVHLPEQSVLSESERPGGKLTVIKEELFKGCTSLKEVNIPTTITKVSDRSFEGCTSLEEIFIPKNVTTVTKTAFKGCSALVVTIEAGTNTNKWAKGWDTDVLDVITL